MRSIEITKNGRRWLLLASDGSAHNMRQFVTARQKRRIEAYGEDWEIVVVRSANGRNYCKVVPAGLSEAQQARLDGWKPPMDLDDR